jgi:hypothetical protein
LDYSCIELHTTDLPILDVHPRRITFLLVLSVALVQFAIERASLDLRIVTVTIDHYDRPYLGIWRSQGDSLYAVADA